MDYNISNTSVDDRISICLDEFHRIKCIIDGMGSMSHPVPYLTRYAIMRACGAIEFGFKTIISDFNLEDQPDHIKNFIDRQFRNSSMNPNYANICKSLASFNAEWSSSFKGLINGSEQKLKIMDSLESLNQARNSFAHGGAPTLTINDVTEYFKDCIYVLEQIEKALEVRND